jgi:hypothetical protein
MLKGAREVRLDWPVSNAFFKPMRDATIAANLTEPTQDMLLANNIQRQALAAFTTDVGLEGLIRKIVGSVDESMDSSACCQQQCALGRSARPLGRAICAQPPRRRAFPTKASPANTSRLALDAAGTSSAVRFVAGGLHRHSYATPPSRAVICPRPCCFRALPSAGRWRRMRSPTSTSGAQCSRRKSTNLGKYTPAPSDFVPGESIALRSNVAGPKSPITSHRKTPR